MNKCLAAVSQMLLTAVKSVLVITGRLGRSCYGEFPDTEKDLPKSPLVHSMDLMAAGVKHNYSPPMSRGPTSAHVSVLLLEAQEAWW